MDKNASEEKRGQKEQQKSEKIENVGKSLKKRPKRTKNHLRKGDETE